MLSRSLLAVSLLSCLACQLQAEDRYERRLENRAIRGRVVAVEDGDTCVVADEAGRRHRVCLYGVDAPERGQAYWEPARTSLYSKIYNKEVRFDPVEVDSEGRNCGRMYIGDHHINLDQVREGYGWHHAEHEQIREFATAEREAREHRRGLWQDRHPVEPWRYRHDHREAEHVDRPYYRD